MNYIRIFSWFAISSKNVFLYYKYLKHLFKIPIWSILTICPIPTEHFRLIFLNVLKHDLWKGRSCITKKYSYCLNRKKISLTTSYLIHKKPKWQKKIGLKAADAQVHSLDSVCHWKIKDITCLWIQVTIFLGLNLNVHKILFSSIHCYVCINLTNNNL